MVDILWTVGYVGYLIVWIITASVIVALVQPKRLDNADWFAILFSSFLWPILFVIGIALLIGLALKFIVSKIANVISWTIKEITSPKENV